MAIRLRPTRRVALCQGKRYGWLPGAISNCVTSNNGFLDQNLYQAVKGMSAAAQIVKEGGLIRGFRVP